MLFRINNMLHVFAVIMLNERILCAHADPLGNKVEIIEPESLRLAMRDMLEMGSGIYDRQA